MAGRKKQEVALQQEIETQEEWEELLTKEGLIAVEVYQEWAGKSQACLGIIKDVLIQINYDKMLILAAAKADTIDSLERYRGKCEPCFLFYAGGSLVAVMRGANSPVLSRMLIGELAKEHKVLNGEVERAEIRDPAFAHLDAQEKASLDEDETEKEEDLVPKEITVALLKPDIVSAGKTDEVLEKMKASGIEILKHEERQLTEEEARDFYGHLASEPFFDELVQFMSSGPSHVLVLSKPDTGKGILEEWRELIGPTSVEEAKEKAPDSLRAQYGQKEMVNALHGSDSHQSAIKELAFFFPDYQIPMIAKGGADRGRTPRHKQQKGVQRTLALIRPDALVDKKDEILQSIKDAGFTIALQKEIQLSEEQVKEFYKEHTEQPYFEELVTKMTSGPVLALGLAREDAIEEWRKLLGPKTVTEAKEAAPQSLRAQYSIEGTEVNMLHGSDTENTAEKELDYFFPMQQTVAVVKPDAYESKDAIMNKIKEAGFHIAARKETTLTKEIASMLYKENSDKDYYNDLIDHMTSGPTLFMVLSKNDAVENWRGVIGPTDPNVAKEQAPDSLRAQFGADVKANAVHAPSTAEDAKQVIDEVFGDVNFTKAGKAQIDDSNTKEGVELLDDEDGGSVQDGIHKDTEGEETQEQPTTSEDAPTTEEQTPSTQVEDEQAKTPAAAEGSRPATAAQPEEAVVSEEEKAAEDSSAAEGEEKTATPAPATEGEEKTSTTAVEGEEKTATPAPTAEEEEKAATPAPAVEGEEKAATPAPAAEGEDKTATPAPAVEGEDKIATPAPAAEGGESAATPAPDVASTPAAEGEKTSTPAPAAESRPTTAAAENTDTPPAEEGQQQSAEAEKPADETEAAAAEATSDKKDDED